MKLETKRYLKTAVAAQLMLTILPLALSAQTRREPPPEMKKALAECATTAGITIGSNPRETLESATPEQREKFHTCMESKRPIGEKGRRGGGPGGPGGGPRGEHHRPPPPSDDGGTGAAQ